ncbi:hypothetical protein WH5701_08354 [Synechococcus sp. WH 5701]|nr:hypothetical protein WH5701_08354 [Synechococcus sp. WH 5701]
MSHHRGHRHRLISLLKISGGK